jgi:hypothetical protein
MGPRAGLNNVEKILDTTGTRSPTLRVIQSVAGSYTDYAGNNKITVTIIYKEHVSIYLVYEGQIAQKPCPHCG